MKNMSLKKKLATSVIAASVSLTSFGTVAHAQETVPSSYESVEKELAAFTPVSSVSSIKAASYNPNFDVDALLNRLIQQIFEVWNNVFRNFISNNSGSNSIGSQIISNPRESTAPAPAPVNNKDALRSQITDGINDYRLTQVSPDYDRVSRIKQSAKLQRGAQSWAEEIARTRNPKHDPQFNVDGAMSENIYLTSSQNLSPQRVINSWANSPGHRNNMLRGNEVGIGIAQDSRGVWYVVARFGNNFNPNQEFLHK